MRALVAALIASVVCVGHGADALAQDTGTVQAVPNAQEQVIVETQDVDAQGLEAQSSDAQDGEGELNPSEIPSLVFTFWEYNAIEDARRSRGLTRAPTDAELTRELNNGVNQLDNAIPKPPPEERDITLGGIVYRSGSDWTIWLNGKRVTPKALPEEVLDLSVYKTYIELKWFDAYSNRILPIRLRTHQRFNIDQRIFLPG